MWSTWLLVVPVLLTRAAQPNHTHSGLSCVNDFITNISCKWPNSEHLAGQACTLHGNRSTYQGPQEIRCALELSHLYHGARGCWLAFPSLDFSFAERIPLEVFCNGTKVSRLNYHLGRNIQLRPLDRPSFYRGNISWSTHPKPKMKTEYQLQFKPLSHSWKDIKPVHVSHSFAVMDSNLFTVGDQYEARVRVKPAEPTDSGQYFGQWSDWSPSVHWTSDIGRNKSSTKDTEDTVSLMPAGLLKWFMVPILVLLASISISMLYRHSCKSKPGSEHVPDPSKYFQPLLSSHGGSFQKWLSHQHSTPSFLTPQPCDCNISPVEISGVRDDTLVNSMKHLHEVCPVSPSSGDSQSSSVFSNMGYFYSETQPGSVCLETCSVYFTYKPEGRTSSTSSYEHLKCQDELQAVSSSPDSGFGMEGQGMEEEKEVDEMKEEGVNVQNLVSFFLSLQGAMTSAAAPHVPLGFAQEPELSPWLEDAEEATEGDSGTSGPPEGAVVRPSSMVVQPCSSGYLTLKEMQAYSNKSI